MEEPWCLLRCFFKNRIDDNPALGGQSFGGMADDVTELATAAADKNPVWSRQFCQDVRGAALNNLKIPSLELFTVFFNILHLFIVLFHGKDLKPGTNTRCFKANRPGASANVPQHSLPWQSQAMQACGPYLIFGDQAATVDDFIFREAKTALFL